MFTFSGPSVTGSMHGRVAHTVLGRLITACYSVVGFAALSVRLRVCARLIARIMGSTLDQNFFLFYFFLF